MRLFLAIAPNREVEAALARRVLDVQAAAGDLASRLRWTPAHNIHATLQFLGEVPSSRAARLRERLGESMDEAPFAVSLGGVGAFPPQGPPRVVWLDVVDGREPLARVQAELGRRLDAAGFPVESRPFSPHLTIARVPDRERAHVKALRERLAAVTDARIEWTADCVTLFRSDLSGAVPRYEPVHEISLQ